MFGLQDFPLPNEIILQFLRYLHGKDLEQCAKVSNRFKDICDKRLEEEKNFESKQDVMTGHIKLPLEIKHTSIDIFPDSLICLMVNGQRYYGKCHTFPHGMEKDVEKAEY